MTARAMLSTAIASNAPLETIREFMAMVREQDAYDARKAYFAAMAKAAGEFTSVAKTKAVDFTSKSGQRTNYNYADLDAFLDMARPVLAKHGLTVTFDTDDTNPNRIKITCEITHEQGHTKSVALSDAPDQSGNKNAIQAVVSTVSYLQRATLRVALGLSPGHDDDGQRSHSGAVNPITPEEASQIEALLGELHLDPKAREKVLRFAGVAAVTEIRAKDRERVLGWLRAKKVAESQAEADAAAAEPTKSDEAAE
jgi:hypothetical protein